MTPNHLIKALTAQRDAAIALQAQLMARIEEMAEQQAELAKQKQVADANCESLRERISLVEDAFTSKIERLEAEHAAKIKELQARKRRSAQRKA